MENLKQFFAVLKDKGYSRDESVVLVTRLKLIKVIRSEILRRQWTQRKAAKILAVAQPRIAEISAFATEKFSVEVLIKYLLKLDLNITIGVKPGKHYMKPKRQRKTNDSIGARKRKRIIRPRGNVNVPNLQHIESLTRGNL